MKTPPFGLLALGIGLAVVPAAFLVHHDAPAVELSQVPEGASEWSIDGQAFTMIRRGEEVAAVAGHIIDEEKFCTEARLVFPVSRGGEEVHVGARFWRFGLLPEPTRESDRVVQCQK